MLNDKLAEDIIEKVIYRVVLLVSILADVIYRLVIILKNYI